MDRTIIIWSIISICIIGLIIKISKIFEYCHTQEFAIEFHNKLVQLTNKMADGIFDNEIYNWLLSNVDKMQNELGLMGYMDFVDNLRGIKGTNIPVLTNLIPEIKNEYNSYSCISNTRVLNTAQTCTNLLIRYDGIINERRLSTRNALFNPFKLFAEGFRWVIHLPVNCMYWLGILSYRTTEKIKGNIIVVVLENIVLVLTLISTVMTIVVGWDEFIAIIVKFVGNFK